MVGRDGLPATYPDADDVPRSRSDATIRRPCIILSKCQAGGRRVESLLLDGVKGLELRPRLVGEAARWARRRDYEGVNVDW